MLWERGSHTSGKHQILSYYLPGWLPIMGIKNGKIVIIDGMAGPGEYIDGEKGSPLIMLDALINHHYIKGIKADVEYIFIEINTRRANNLRKLVATRIDKIPSNCKIKILNSKISLYEELDRLERENIVMPPIFLLLDPDGVSDIPLSTLAKVLKNKKSEVMVNIMYEFINRFGSTPEFTSKMDEIYGLSDWRQYFNNEYSTKQRINSLSNLYTSQLKSIGAEYVLKFKIYDGNRHKYTLFFATHNEEGCNKMKQAMWKVDPLGRYEYRGEDYYGAEQSYLLDNFSWELKQELHDVYDDQEIVRVDEIQKYMKSDRTSFHSSHWKSVLKQMELNGEIHVIEEPQGRRKGTYAKPEKIYVKFKNIAQ